MGGYGSGRSGGRPIAEQSLALSFDRGLHASLAALKRSGERAHFHTARWTMAGRERATCGLYLIQKQDGGALMVLSYTVNGTPRQQAIDIDWTPTPFGQRPWWRCPRCARRCLRLYNPGAGWFCRRCGDVTYLSSNESDKRLAYRRIMGLTVAPASASVSALILALRGYDRIRKKVERDFRRAGHGKPGRPPKHNQGKNGAGHKRHTAKKT
jgi:hypothetical protein